MIISDGQARGIRAEGRQHDRPLKGDGEHRFARAGPPHPQLSTFITGGQ